MRWNSNRAFLKRHGWVRRFAFLPVTCDGETVWLELYWRRCAGEYDEAWFGELPPYLDP